MKALEISNQDLSRLADEAMDLATTYWASLDDRPAYPSTSGRETTELFSRPWAEEGRGRDVLHDFKLIAEHARPSAGRFFAYVFGSGEPVGAVGELLAAVLNQNVSSWRSAPAATSIEHAVVGWLAEAVGCAGFTGSLCGGGSAANLMALAMAREAKLPANETGVRGGVVYASEQVHMSIAKAVALLGIGRANLRLVPVDDQFRMRPDALQAAIAADRAAGRIPIAIVATVGTIVSGAIDPLPEIAAIAGREGMWLHVDGAYGVLAALALPETLNSLALADSLSLDAHKWLYQPLDCGCLLHRHPDIARRTFSHSDDYVGLLSQDPTEGFAFFDQSFELSRRFRALKLWLSLQYHGRRAFREAIAEDLRHARLLAETVEAHPELELLAPVPLSAVCFRHRAKDNRAILRRVIARGRVYLSNATVHDQFALRACFVNHRTTDGNVLEIVSEVIAAAAELND
ncbi:MAG: aminotransferase class V-fold PLP-dependent enzyme [Mesorhizobium sp.]|uniref:pyridoxal phosphate-dependent decarboxylase family protein n=1 Tax=unclassified Mesorhizobium TaxID=325217 RepID=UPI000F754BAA|nr:MULTISPECIES: aminotransferase class V-fold PLP-dependent enzyme [unclassified Mesorhizobium]AZO47938.1 aminotransferase class V-fold PLP-dependent enzyme [Mesorhizobium sp. M4B.F.Ca.ET.058.02.1.1]RVC46476.1 aminotransferase class V-fold PLP-dependent enzyme [Mesorhizobium sp. M4A.F.Ca.ET.090.04.2.1]RVC74555.1 aminotransferase class V-fold PLP-dependent enzyme [Mesorhizobium sp. M4A.F.Ca.ET.022.05.2.1]RWC42661.1 MAG: aminotransferase class V-fold PLP-dependent enzyme [Mesorhizobium sp.]RWD0